MSEWSYVVAAYLIVWGALAGYALVLARRVTRTKEVDEALRESELRESELREGERREGERHASEDIQCDGSPVP